MQSMAQGKHDRVRHPRMVPTFETALTNLGGGYCNSYQLGSVITQNTLYMGFLNGTTFPGSVQSKDFYIASLSLNDEVDITNTTNFQLSSVTQGGCPSLDGATLWLDPTGTKIISYGGVTSPEPIANVHNIFYEFDTMTGACGPYQDTAPHQPRRLDHGASIFVPEVKAAFHLGGYQDNLTNASITGSSEQYPHDMFSFNTSSGITTHLPSPFYRLSGGSLQYLPLGKQGVLIYLGGASSQSRSDQFNLTSNDWGQVQIFDIARKLWFSQSTSGTVPQRMDFCSVTASDPVSGTYEIYVLGGIGGGGQGQVRNVSFLSIPSFKWYTSQPLNQGHVALSCNMYGSQILAAGGQLAYVDPRACVGSPLFIYDTNAQAAQETFYPSSTIYTVPATVAADIKESPYPATWADPALQAIFTTGLGASPDPVTVSSSPTSTSGSISTNFSQNSSSHNTTGAIVGGVVGGILGLCFILAGLYLVLRRRRSRTPLVELPNTVRAEVNGESKPPMSELSGRLSYAPAELPASRNVQPTLHEFNSDVKAHMISQTGTNAEPVKRSGELTRFELLEQ